MLKAVATESLAASGITIGTSVITGGTNTRVLFDDNGVVGESSGLTYAKTAGTLSIPSNTLAIDLGTAGGVTSTPIVKYETQSNWAPFAASSLGGSSFTASGLTFFDDTLGYGFNYSGGGNKFVSTAGMMGFQFESDYWANSVHSMEWSFNTRSAPIVTATFGGTITNGDTMSLIATGTYSGSPVTKTITASGASTTTTLATAMAAAINADATLKLVFIAASSGAVVNIANVSATGIGTVWSRVNGATETITLATGVETNVRPMAFGTDRDNGPNTPGYQNWFFGIGNNANSYFTVNDSTLNTPYFSITGTGSSGGGVGKMFGYLELDPSTAHLAFQLNQKTPASFNLDTQYQSNGTNKWLLSVRTTATSDMWWFDSVANNPAMVLYSSGGLSLGTATNINPGVGSIRVGATGNYVFAGAAVPFLKSIATITSGAGAQAGTLLNSPAAGNPTSWIPINDNGTTRYIPAW